MAGSIQQAIDILAIDDLPDPEQLGTGEDNVVRALARRLLQPEDANAEIGDDEPIETLDLREYLGGSPSPEEILDLEQRIERCIADDERVAEVETVEVNYGETTLSVSVSALGAEGPFSFVLTVDALTASLLIGGE